MRALTVEQVRRRARWLVVTRLTLVGGIIGALAFAAVLGPPTSFSEYEPPPPSTEDLIRIGTPGLVSTSFLIVTMLRLVLRAQRPTRVAFGYTMIASVLNAPLYFVLDGISDAFAGHRPIHGASDVALLFGGAGLIAIPGLLLTVPLGAVYGVVHYVAISEVEKALAAPTQRTLERVRFGLLGIPLAGACALIVLAFYSDYVDELAGWAARGFGVLALYELVMASFVTLRRYRWLAALHADRIPDHRLVPRADCRVPEGVVPLEPVGDDALGVVASPPGAPYRDRPDALMLVPPR